MFQLIFGMIGMASILVSILFIFGAMMLLIENLGIGGAIFFVCFLLTSYWFGGVMIC